MPTIVVAALFFLLLPASLSVATSHKSKPPCKQIKEAVAAGHTLAQITAEFQVDEQQVVKCTQGKSKHRKPSTGAANPQHPTAPKPQAPARVAP